MAHRRKIFVCKIALKCFNLANKTTYNNSVGGYLYLPQ